MTTINTSDEAYRRLLKIKQEMEEESGRLVSISKALDAKMGIKEYV
jgi:predicted CopG family antitoxin